MKVPFILSLVVLMFTVNSLAQQTPEVVVVSADGIPDRPDLRKKLQTGAVGSWLGECERTESGSVISTFSLSKDSKNPDSVKMPASLTWTTFKDAKCKADPEPFVSPELPSRMSVVFEEQVSMNETETSGGGTLDLVVSVGIPEKVLTRKVFFTLYLASKTGAEEELHLTPLTPFREEGASDESDTSSGFIFGSIYTRTKAATK